MEIVRLVYHPHWKQRYLMFISCKSISKICFILWGFMIFGYKHTIQRREMNIKICIIRYKATTNRVFIRGWEVSTIIYYMLRDFIMKRNWIYWINAKMCWIPFIILITDTIFSQYTRKLLPLFMHHKAPFSIILCLISCRWILCKSRNL